MAATGVLPFIRGVDLSGNDFKVRVLIQYVYRYGILLINHSLKRGKRCMLVSLSKPVKMVS